MNRGSSQELYSVSGRSQGHKAGNKDPRRGKGHRSPVEAKDRGKRRNEDGNAGVANTIDRAFDKE